MDVVLVVEIIVLYGCLSLIYFGCVKEDDIMRTIGLVLTLYALW